MYRSSCRGSNKCWRRSTSTRITIKSRVVVVQVLRGPGVGNNTTPPVIGSPANNTTPEDGVVVGPQRPGFQRPRDDGAWRGARVQIPERFGGARAAALDLRRAGKALSAGDQQIAGRELINAREDLRARY